MITSRCRNHSYKNAFYFLPSERLLGIVFDSQIDVKLECAKNALGVCYCVRVLNKGSVEADGGGLGSRWCYLVVVELAVVCVPNGCVCPLAGPYNVMAQNK